MKKGIDYYFLIFFCSILIFSCFSIFADVELENPYPELSVIETPPVILFDTTMMVSNNILQIIVYDTDSNLSTVHVYHNDNLLNASVNFTISWYYVDYSNTSTPLSLSSDQDADPDTNTFEGDLNTDTFEEGEHNNVTVIAENEVGLIGIATYRGCSTVHCWGGGGGGGNTPVQPDHSFMTQTNIPEIIFDMSCYFTENRINTIIEGNGAIIEAYTIEKVNSTLTAWVYTDENVEYYAGIRVDEDIENVDCPECEVPTVTVTVENSFPFLPLLAGFSFLIAIFILRKRKKM